MAKLAIGKQSGGHAKKKEISGKRSNATLNRYLHALSGAFKYAVSELDLPKNPVYGLATKKEPKGIVRYLSDDERKRLLTACRESGWRRLYLLILLAITTGARRGELMRLRWSDIDIKRRTAIVNQTNINVNYILIRTSMILIKPASLSLH